MSTATTGGSSARLSVCGKRHSTALYAITAQGARLAWGVGHDRGQLPPVGIFPYAQLQPPQDGNPHHPNAGPNLVRAGRTNRGHHRRTGTGRPPLRGMLPPRGDRTMTHPRATPPHTHRYARVGVMRHLNPPYVTGRTVVPRDAVNGRSGPSAVDGSRDREPVRMDPLRPGGSAAHVRGPACDD